MQKRGILLFSHIAVRLKWSGGALGLYKSYLKKMCHFEISDNVFNDKRAGHTALLRDMFWCAKCLAKRAKRKKKKKKGVDTTRCGCRFRPMYFSFDNVHDIQTLSDVVKKPLLIVAKKDGAVLFDNRTSYEIVVPGAGAGALAMLIMKNGRCRQMEQTVSGWWSDPGDPVGVKFGFPTGPSSGASLALVRCLASFIPADGADCSVFYPETEVSLQCRSEKAGQASEALDTLALMRDLSSAISSREGIASLNTLVSLTLRCQRLALVTRKKRCGKVCDQGWCVLGVYGISDARGRVVNSQGKYDHFTDHSLIDWSRAAAVELCHDHFLVLTPEVTLQIPEAVSSSERRVGGSSQKTKWKEKYDQLKRSGVTCVSKRGHANHVDMTKAPKLGLSPCSSCTLCTRDMHKWSKLAGHGIPQQQIHRSPDNLIDLLDMFGFWTPEMEKKVERCFQLSVATVDIEAATMNVNAGEHRHLDAFEHIGEMNLSQIEESQIPELLTKHAMFSTKRTVSSQKPVLMCAMDGMTGGDYAHLNDWRENWKDECQRWGIDDGGSQTPPRLNPLGGAGVPAFFFVKNPSEWNDVCKKYLRHEISRHREAMREKAKILSPVVNFLNHLKAHHFMYRIEMAGQEVKLAETDVASDDTQEDLYLKLKKKIQLSARNGWNFCPLGKLEREVTKLVNCRRIYSFNGSGYDHLMLCPGLTMAAVETKMCLKDYVFRLPDPDPKLFCRDVPCEYAEDVEKYYHEDSGDTWITERSLSLNVTRAGSKINQMSIKKSGIVWCDAMKLLPAGTSLSKFSKMMCLEESKGAFPFSALTSFESLLEPGLPEDPRAWDSILGGGRRVDDSRVRECMGLYRELGCKNRLSYLAYYLLMDVALLLAGVQKFDSLFVKLIGTSPMRQQKFTAASFAFAAVNRYLKNNNCPGFFASTHPVIQGMTQSAMRGGVTGMYTSLGGKACPVPINHHIYLAQQRQEQEEEEDEKEQSFHWRPYARDPDLADKSQLAHANHVVGYDIHSLYASAGKRTSRALLRARRTRGPRTARGGRRPRGLRTPDELIFNFFNLIGVETLPYGPGSFYTLFVKRSSKEPAEPVQQIPPHTPELHREIETFFNKQIYPKEPSSELSPRPPDQFPRYFFRALKPAHERRGHALQRVGEFGFVQFAALKAFPKGKRFGSCLHAGPGQRVWGGFSGDRIDFSAHLPPRDGKRNRLVFVNYHEKNIHYTNHLRTGRRARLGQAFLKDCLRPDTCQDRDRVFTWEPKTERRDARRREYTEIMNEALRCGGYEDLVHFEYLVVTECQLFHDTPSLNNRFHQFPTSVPDKFHLDMRADHGEGYLWTTPPELSYAEMINVLCDDSHQRMRTQIFPIDGATPATGYKVGGFVGMEGGEETETDRVSNIFGYCFQKGSPEPDELGPMSLAQSGYSLKTLTNRCASTTQTSSRLSYDHGELEIQGTQLFRWQMMVRKLRNFSLRHVLLYPVRRYLEPFLSFLLQLRWFIKKGDVAGIRSHLGLDENTGTAEGLMQFNHCAKLLINAFYGYAAIRTDRFPVSRVLRGCALERNELFEDFLCYENSQPIPPREAFYFSRNGLYHCPACGFASRAEHFDKWDQDAVCAHQSSISALERSGCNFCKTPAQSICAVIAGENAEKLLTNPLSITTLGHTLSKKGPNKLPRIEPYYLYTRRDPNPTLSNVAAVASTILSTSKVIFFDKLHALLHCMSSSRAGLLYTDTDSVYFSTVSPELEENCLDPDRRSLLKRLLSKIMASDSSGLSQHGKFGLEIVRSRGLFRGVKCKYLTDSTEPDDPARVVTLKGIPRSIHDKITQEHFLETELFARWPECSDLHLALWQCRECPEAQKTILQDASDEQKEIIDGICPPSYAAQYIRLRGRKSLDIGLSTERRTIGSGINLKRRMIVSFCR